jgi:DNA repair exonuclease SbcCD ATPase subunit
MDGNLNIDDLNNRKSELTSSIEVNETTIQNKTGKISDYFDVLIELKQLVEEKSKSNGIDIEVAYSNLQEEKKKLVEAEKVHSNAKLYLSLAEEKIKHLDNHKYDPNCKFCCDNTFVKDAMNAKTTLPELQQIVKDALIDAVGIQQTLDRWEGIEEQYNEWNTLKTKYEKGKNIHKNATLELSGLITQKELYESQLTNVEADIERYHTNEATIESNKILQQQIDDKKIELNDVTKYLRDINTKLLGVNGDIVKTNSYIKSIEDKMAEAKGLEEQYQIYEYYLDSIKRDGVSYELISKALPVIEGEVNNILHQIVDFGVTLQMDGKSINGKIVYDDQEWPLEMCSGMEKFISGLAIRVALINVCHLPRPNFLVIDEGFGTLDSENLTSMFMLFDYLKTQFDYIIVISHLDQMRDIVDNLIEIKKIDGFSSIIYK